MNSLRKTVVICSLLVLVFVGLVAVPTIISGKTFYGVDGNIGIIKVNSESMWKFQNERWYNNYLLGFPFGVTLSLSPFIGRIIGYELVPVFDVIMYIVVSFLGMYIFLRSSGLTVWASIFGATSISLTTSGVLTVLGGHINGSISFLILALGIVKYIYSKQLSFLKLLILTVISGISLGIAFIDFQRTIYFGIVLGAYIIFLTFIRVGKLRNFLSLEKSEWFRIIGVPIAIFLVFLLFSMNTITGFFGLVQAEQVGVKKDDPESKWRFLVQFSTPPEEILNFVIPGVFGYFSGDSNLPYWGRAAQDFDYEKTKQGMRNFRLGIDNYVGVFVVPFVLLSLLFFKHWDWDRRKHFIFWVVVAIITFLLSIARYFPTLFWLLIQIPFMDRFRVPGKWIDMFTISIIVLSAISFDSFIRNLGQKTRENKLVVYYLFIYSGVLFLIYLILSGLKSEISLHFTTTQQYDYTVSQKISENIANAFGNAFIFILLGTIVLYLLEILSSKGYTLDERFSTKFLVSDVVFVGFVIIVFVNMFIVARPIFKQVDPYKLYSETELVKFMKEKTQDEQTRFVFYSGLANHYLTFLFPYYGLESIQTIPQSRLSEEYTKFLPFISSFNFDVMAKYGTGYFITELPPTHQVFLQLPNLVFYTNIVSKIYLSEEQPSITHSVYVYKITNSLPRFYMTPNYIKYNGQIEMVLMMPIDVLRNSVLITNDITDFVSSQSFTYNIAVEKFTSDYVKLKLVNSDKGFLVFNTYYHPKWECYVDGQKKEIMKANYLIQAVYIDTPGEHTVEFRFNSFSPFAVVQLVLLGVFLVSLPLLRFVKK